MPEPILLLFDPSIGFRNLVFRLFIVFGLLNLAACDQKRVPPDQHPVLSKLTVPPGFEIDFFAEQVEGARSMCVSPSGTVFVGTRDAGNVYALVDMDKDGHADKKITIASGLNMPNGVALQSGDLYVAEISRILIFRDIERSLDSPPMPEILYDGYPTDVHHGWKYIAFGPDSMLYVPVGAPCNVCESDDPIYATITRIDLKKGIPVIIHRGVRNSVGMDWDPLFQDMWFTDNGRDNMGDDIPADELNWAPVEGKHFGFPYCHQGDLPDPEFGEGHDCSEYRAPIKKLGAHVAALGIEFYEGLAFPKEYQGHLFLCEHGSWNRSAPVGYRVTLARTGKGQVISYEPFIKGWLQENGEVLGRPVDLEMLQDGSLLISDDYGDAIYRVSYVGPAGI